MTFSATGSETGGRFALMEYHTKPGNEPPPHVHEWEHELYFVLEGAMRFYYEDKTLDIGAGDVVFLPQGKAHAFTCTSNVVRTLIFVCATGGCCRPGQLFPRDGRTGRKHGFTRIRRNVCAR
jgi:mannose-6-phosphate isomerase-like protein (cupin superfamily)